MGTEETNDVYDLIVRVGNRFMELAKRPFDLGSGEKLYPAELHALEAIGRHGELTVGELSELCGVTLGGTSQTIARLERKQYVRKTRRPESRREKRLTLTPKGQAAFAAHADLHERLDREMVQSLAKYSTEEVGLLKEVLLMVDEHLAVFLALSG